MAKRAAKKTIKKAVKKKKFFFLIYYLDNVILVLYLHPHSGNAILGEVAQLVRAQDS